MRAPSGLGKRGRALWRDLTKDRELGPSAGALATEICRIADRLERLDEVLRGDADVWFSIKAPERGGELTVVVDNALSEARQQAATLRQLVATLEDMTSKESDEPSPALAAFLAGLSSPLRN
jgi:hypothetical protein